VAAFGLSVPDPLSLFTDSILGAVNPGAPALTIEEIEGSRRLVELRGRALPYRNVAWGGRMRTKNTWYQGNPNATQQVLGPELLPSVLEGKWKDRFMFGAEVGNESQILVNGSPDEVKSAESAVALFNDIRRSGNSLKVIWGTQVRVGILVEFVPTFERVQDVGWRMEFEWRGEEDVTPRGAAQTELEPAGLLDGINGLDDILGFSPEDVTRAFNAQLLDSVGSVRARVGDLFEVLRTVEAVASTPQSVLGAMSAAVDSIRLEATEEIGRLTESSAVGEEGVTVSVRPASLMQVEAYRRTTARRMATVRGTSLETARQTQLQATPVQIQIITVPEESSLYALSSRFYGNPDFAGFLARNNGLSSAIVPAGFQLRVPPKPTAAEAANTSTDIC
jgi:hypothetical protein